MRERGVVITGVSTGIGLGAAQVLVRAGFQVFGSVRRAEDGARVQGELGARFTPLHLDVTDPAALRAAARQVEEALGGATLAGLVNNAGVALPGPLLHQPPEELEEQLRVNVLGPLLAVQAFAPLLGVDRTRSGPPGRIVNIGSVAGKMAAPFLGGYAASKHALEGMSESLRRELMPWGIEVVVVAPGAVATPIWGKGAAGAERYADTDYAEALQRFGRYALRVGRNGLPVEAIGEVVREALTAPRPRLRYAPVPGKLRNWTLPRLLPRRVLDGYIARGLGLSRR
jgi:NAD(P)-dependent dehydrogenase (short-subunit alcohol dehydrogenase family)